MAGSLLHGRLPGSYFSADCREEAGIYVTEFARSDRESTLLKVDHSKEVRVPRRDQRLSLVSCAYSGQIYEDDFMRMRCD
jgi:hypothetical protein